MKKLLNLEYRTLDKLGRTKQTFHGGVFLDEALLEKKKQEIITSNKQKVAFDIYELECLNLRG